jgi:hypothetical protein
VNHPFNQTRVDNSMPLTFVTGPDTINTVSGGDLIFVRDELISNKLFPNTYIHNLLFGS